MFSSSDSLFPPLPHSSSSDDESDAVLYTPTTSLDMSISDDTPGDAPDAAQEYDEYLTMLSLPTNTVIAPADWKNLYYSKKFGGTHLSEDFLPSLCHEYLQGLVWVLGYYYDGVPSWKWYYPYHYAPLVSDLICTTSFDFSFDRGTPFPPLCQLLAVLSPLSYKLLPKPYADLMTSPTSPLKELYPLDFEIDREGTKNPWEGVVILPFIDEDILFACVNKISPLSLSPEELSRNEFSSAMHFQYNSKTRHPTHVSTMSLYAPISKCCCGGRPSRITDTDSGPPLYNHFHLMADTGTGVRAPPLFPSLFWLPTDCRLDSAPVNLFGYPTRRPSLVLEILSSLPETSKDLDLQALADELLGKSVFVGYPYCREGLVVGLSTETEVVNDKSSGQVVPLEDAKKFREHAKNAIKNLFAKAISLKSVSVILYVRSFVGIQESPDGVQSKIWKTSADPFPIEVCDLYLSLSHSLSLTPPSLEAELFPQVVVRNVPSWNLVFSTDRVRSLAERFPLGSRVVYVAPGEHFGREAVVARHDKESKIEISFLFQNLPEPDFAAAVLRSEGDDPSQWMDYNAAAAALGMPLNSLFRVTSSINILYREIGLTVRFGNRNIETLGCTRKRGRWEISVKCMEEIRQYKQQFPHFFTVLDQVEDHLQAFHLFPGADRETMENKLDEMVSFIGSLSCSLAKRVTVGSEIASAEAVKKLQKVFFFILRCSQRF